MPKPTTSTIFNMDCRKAMQEFMQPNSVDSVVTDPPYGLGFMGKGWDKGVPGVEFWKAAYDVLKPGGYMLAFSGSRTYHRMVCAIEDAGFEIRDQIMWVYGSGFPKSLDVSKAIDKAAGAEREQVAPRSVIGHQRNIGNRRPYMDDPNHTTDSDIPATAAQQWQGWGTALKPAHEPICVARKPFPKGYTVAENVLEWGTGAINIDGCRVSTDELLQQGRTGLASVKFFTTGATPEIEKHQHPPGRWPANLIHDGSDEVLAMFPESTSGSMSSATKRAAQDAPGSVCYGTFGGAVASTDIMASSGSASRFFYCAKASKSDRGQGNDHPTVKPTALMQYLVRMVTPPGGSTLDPFTGSGSTGIAAALEGFNFIGCEDDSHSANIAVKRIADRSPSTTVRLQTQMSVEVRLWQYVKALRASTARLSQLTATLDDAL